MELVYTDLNLEEVDETELLVALNQDLKTYYTMRRKIIELQKTREPLTKNDEKKSEQSFLIFEEDASKQDVDSNFESEVDYYYSLVSKVDGSDLRNNLIEVLPSTEHYQYRKILLRMNAEILRYAKFIRELSNDKDATQEDKAYFKAEIDFEQRKFNIISDLLNVEKVETCVKEVKKNKIILLPTLNDNIHILDNISSIDVEFYDRFYELVKSIENGTFKNVKRFVNNESLLGLSEVRDFQTRVLFKRVNKDTYVIIGAFVKKTDNDALYRSTVIRYYDLYKRMESIIQASLNDEEFLTSQAESLNELYDMLQTKSSKVLKKGGI